MRNSGVILILLSVIVCLYSCKNQEKVVVQPNDNDIKLSQMIIDAATEREIGNMEKACAIYGEVLKLSPNNALAYYQLSAINYEQRNIANAIEYNLKAIELNPKNHWYRLQLAEIYLQTKQIEKVAEQYKAIIELQPEVTEYYMELASIYGSANMFYETIGVLNLLEKRQGVNEYCSMLKYKLYKQADKQNKAVKEIESLCKEYPSNVSYLSTLSQNYLTMGQDKKALELMQKIENIDSNNVENIVALMEFHYKHQEDSLSERYVAKLCKSTQMDFEEKNQLILGLYQEKVDTDLHTLLCYMTHLETMSKMYPEEGRLWHFLSIAYTRTHKMQEAYTACKKAIEYGIEDLDLFKTCVIAQELIASPKEIIEVCDKALEFYPRELIFFIIKGHNLNTLQQYESAIEILEKGLKLKPRREDYLIDIYNGLAESYYRTDRKEKAWSCFEEVLKMNPNNLFTLNNYAYYLCLENTNLEKAEEMSRTTYEAEPTNITFADTYAWVLYTKKDYIKAKEILDKFLESQEEWSETIKNHYQEILKAINE